MYTLTLLGGIQPTPAKIDRELQWLADFGATIVHCPIVSGRLGKFLDSFAKFCSRGINIGLGTDTYPPDIIRNMHAGVISSIPYWAKAMDIMSEKTGAFKVVHGKDMSVFTTESLKQFDVICFNNTTGLDFKIPKTIVY